LLIILGLWSYYLRCDMCLFKRCYSREMVHSAASWELAFLCITVIILCSCDAESQHRTLARVQYSTLQSTLCSYHLSAFYVLALADTVCQIIWILFLENTSSVLIISTPNAENHFRHMLFQHWMCFLSINIWYFRLTASLGSFTTISLLQSRNPASRRFILFEFVIIVIY